jgi:hypothetical protein
MTLTEFEENTIKDLPETGPEDEHGGDTPPPPDTAGFIAEKIVDGVRTGAAEVFAHDWMKKPR